LCKIVSERVVRNCVQVRQRVIRFIAVQINGTAVLTADSAGFIPHKLVVHEERSIGQVKRAAVAVREVPNEAAIRDSDACRPVLCVLIDGTAILPREVVPKRGAVNR
jgi:hypothetical protein